ncbi:zona pellucida sperm-binding protein 3-like [Embiotoca jacksoni]|uniref:zona pellucida sperm-binding protein 3-like n=1 Tax=Embiotoca jacksoni TaxID=100190 RepID=UPI0037038454
MFWLNFLLGLFLSGLRVRSSFAFPPTQYTQHALFQGPQPPQSQSSTHAVLEQQKEGEQVNTVSVSCRPDSLEIVIKADVFAVGAPVNRDDLRLGVEHKDYCRAAASSGDEYRIIVGLADCGTKHWMTEDSLVYTNLLIYSPAASLNGVIRMDEAVIPIECHYERKYSLSSSSLRPTWIPFMSTQAAVETLQFDLKLMTNDWQYKRSANVFHLGEPISIEASVRVGHHMGLRLFLSSCVATLYPDIHSHPKYTFVENGCLVDSQLPGSNAHFLPRTQDDKLQLVIDAFRFHNDDRGELYITCHLNAVPVNDAEVPNKACTFMNGRWRSADGNDYLCSYCQSQNEVGQTHTKPSNPGKFGPRGFGKPAESEPLWRSGMNTNRVWEQAARVGPVMVLPSHKSGPSPNVSWMDKSGPLPVAELPPVLHKISRTSLYGSQWRSGINGLDLKTGLLPGPPETPDLDEEIKDGKSITGEGGRLDN